MTKVYIHVSTTFCREDLLHSLWQRQSSRAAFCCVLIHVSRSRMKGCWAHLPWDHVSTWSHGEEREKGWKEGKGRWRGRRREGEEGIARERDLGAEGPRGRGFPFLREKEASPPPRVLSASWRAAEGGRRERLHLTGGDDDAGSWSSLSRAADDDEGAWAEGGALVRCRGSVECAKEWEMWQKTY